MDEGTQVEMKLLREKRVIWMTDYSFIVTGEQQILQNFFKSRVLDILTFVTGRGEILGNKRGKINF